jgi:hypothetical protein
MAAELDQLVGQFRYEAVLEEVGRLPTAPNGTARAGVEERERQQCVTEAR